MISVLQVKETASERPGPAQGRKAHADMPAGCSTACHPLSSRQSLGAFPPTQFRTEAHGIHQNTGMRSPSEHRLAVPIRTQAYDLHQNTGVSSPSKHRHTVTIRTQARSSQQNTGTRSPSEHRHVVPIRKRARGPKRQKIEDIAMDMKGKKAHALLMGM